MKRELKSTDVCRRRGLSLVVVMVAISMTMVMAYAALSSQARGVQVRQNVNRQAMARQAAESAAAIALNQLQSSTWSGVATPLAGTLSSDNVGSTSYSVTFLTIDGQSSPAAYPAGQGKTALSGSSAFFNTSSNGLSTSSADTAATATRQAFQLLIRSAGKWQSATDVLDFVTETVEVGIELQPRVPGRTIVAPDITEATDVLASNGGYDTIQKYALFASTGSTVNPSLTLQPGQRIDGLSWLTQGVSVFSGPTWTAATRSEFLLSTGTVYSSTSGSTVSLLHPHPFGGAITMQSSFSASEISDLTLLKVSRQIATSTPSVPAITFANWKTYQLYQGGFTYNATTLSNSTLTNIVLRPSQLNPLGVVYYQGNLTIGSNTIVQGTIVCSGQVTINGNNINLASVNWRDSTGGTLVSSADLFPRAPAIVAQNLVMSFSPRAVVDGAVLLTSTFTGSDGSYNFVSGANINLNGSQATSAPIRQPYSHVQLPATTSLTGVLSDGTHAIWLAEGNSGNWFTIVGVDATNHQLTILGEATRSSPTTFSIRRKRVNSFDLRGPLMATRVSLSASSSWKLTTGLWNNQYAIWQLITQNQANNNQPLTPFVTWVADPSTYNGWGSPWETAGLPLEPVIHVRPQLGVKFRDSLPLFRSYVPPTNLVTTTNDPSGYRWRVLFWRDMP